MNPKVRHRRSPHERAIEIIRSRSTTLETQNGAINPPWPSRPCGICREPWPIGDLHVCRGIP